jgi:hypothetical protein
MVSLNDLALAISNMEKLYLELQHIDNEGFIYDDPLIEKIVETYGKEFDVEENIDI